jgi:hypothetical protein
MTKIKTFTSSLKIFHVKEELDALDKRVNRFAEENHLQKIISVSDACTTDENGATIGLIRVIAYE